MEVLKGIAKIPDFVTQKGNCEKHGDFESLLVKYRNSERWSMCPKCMHDNHANEVNKKIKSGIEAEKQKAIARLFGNCGIDEMFRSRTLTQLGSTEFNRNFLEGIRHYVVSLKENIINGRGLFLSGSPGVGKTHAACALVNATINNGMVGLFTEVSDIINDYNSAITNGGTHKDAIEKYTRANLIAIDEFTGRMSDNDLHIMTQIINSLYKRKKSFIIVTNLSPEDFENVYGDRIFDRVLEKTTQLICIGESWRKNSKGNEKCLNWIP